MDCLSFFNGFLGLDSGLGTSGVEHLLFCENDFHAFTSIKLNKPNVPLIVDFLDLNAQDILSNNRVK